MWARLVSGGGGLRGVACSWRATGPGEPGFGPISEARGPALGWPNGAQRGEKRRPAWEKKWATAAAGLWAEKKEE